MEGSNHGKEWEDMLSERLALYGHRNWIVVADSAYPQQSQRGVETIQSGVDHIRIIKLVTEAIARSKHLRPRIYIDSELQFVPDSDAPGVEILRGQISDSLHEYETTSLPHDEIIAKLDRAAQMFNVLVIKTSATIPYTSIFLELNCGYWDEGAEARLRESIRATLSTEPLRSAT